MLVSFDKAGAEWVVVAYASGDQRMIDVVERGVSPHVVTGALISRLPEDVIEQENKLVGQQTDPDAIRELRLKKLPSILKLEEAGKCFLPRTMSIRQMGKKSNHALNYKMGYRRFALENEIDEAEARKIVEYYTHVAYPGLNNWWRETGEQLRKDRTLTNCFGRRRKFYDAWGPDLLDAAYSFIPQSSVADLLHQGTLALMNSRERCLSNLELLEQVHDSLTLQWLGTRLEELLAALQLIALDYLNLPLTYKGRTFHIKTEIKMGLNKAELVSVDPHLPKPALKARLLEVGRSLGVWS